MLDDLQNDAECSEKAKLKVVKAHGGGGRRQGASVCARPGGRSFEWGLNCSGDIFQPSPLSTDPVQPRWRFCPSATYMGGCKSRFFFFCRCGGVPKTSSSVAFGQHLCRQTTTNPSRSKTTQAARLGPSRLLARRHFMSIFQ